MLVITDSIDINVKPEKVFQFLKSLRDDESYRKWHPDHVTLRWLRGEPFQEGSTLYAEERIQGKLFKLKLRIFRVVPNREIRYGHMFPLSLFAPGYSFLMEPKGDGSCTFTATSKLRVGPLGKRALKRVIELAKQHMKEEGENLKRILEQG